MTVENSQIQVINGDDLSHKELKVAIKQLYGLRSKYIIKQVKEHPENFVLTKISPKEYCGIIKFTSNEFKSDYYLKSRLNIHQFLPPMMIKGILKAKKLGYSIITIGNGIIHQTGDISDEITSCVKFDCYKRFWNKQLLELTYRLNDNNTIETLVPWLKKSLRYVDDALNYIKNNHIENLEIIMQIIAENDPEGTSKRIKEFNIEDENLRFEIAKQIATKNGWIVKYIHNFELKSEKKRYAVARLAIIPQDKICSMIGIGFLNFNILNPKRLSQIVLLLARYDTLYWSYSSKLQIMNEDLKFRIAIKLAMRGPLELLGNLEHLRIKDEVKRHRIFIIAIKYHCYEDYVKSFKSFQIEHPMLIFDLAVRFINQSRTSLFIQYFKNLEIEPEKLRLYLSKKIAKKYPLAYAEHFSLFNIQNRHYRFMLAKIVAVSAGKNVIVPRFIKNFGDFTDVENYAIAYHLTKNQFFAKEFHISKIKDEERRMSLLKRFGKKYPNEVWESFDHLNISTEEQKIEFAKYLVNIESSNILRFLPHVDIENEKELYHLCKIHLKNITINLRSYDVVKIIEKFKSERYRYHLLKRSFNLNPSVCSSFLNQLDLKLERLEKLALIVAEKAPYDLLVEINDFDVEENIKERIINQAKYHFYLSLFTNEWEFLNDIEIESKVIDILKILDSEDPTEEKIDIWIRKLREFNFGKILDLIEVKKNIELQHHLLKWLTPIIGILNLQKINDEEYEVIQKDLALLVNYRNPNLRNQMTKLRFSFDEETRKYWIKISKDYVKSYDRLTQMILAPTGRFKDKIDQWINKRRSFLKDTLKLQLFHSFLFLNRYPLIEELFSLKNLNKNELTRLLRAVIDLEAFGELDHLDSLQNGSKRLEELFARKFGLMKIDHFGDKYLNTIGHFRDRSAILTYGAKIKESSQLFELFKLYLRSVLEGTFQDERYDKNKSLHLKKVFTGRNELEEEWKKGEKIAAIDLMDGALEENKTFNFRQFIDEKIHVFNHLGEDLERRYPYLTRVLSGNNVEEISDNHMLEKIIIENLNKKLSHEEAREVFRKLENYVPKEVEFYNDIKTAIDTLQSRQIELSRLIVEDTDDPCDLLLIGTETPSCQRVDGDFKFNKCLLGYLLEGKVRAVVVRLNKRIIGRSIFRILLDGKTGVPVLLQERIYMSTQSKTVKKLIDRMCIRRARALKLPLLSKDDVKGEKYPNSIVSKGNRSLYEYVDSVQEVTNGIYKINKPLTVHFTP